MSGLDPLSRIRVRRQLHLQRGDGCAVLMSTHSLADVEDLADRVAILHAGSLRFIGTLDEWLGRYGSRQHGRGLPGSGRCGQAGELIPPGRGRNKTRAQPCRARA
jgi:ABC-type multidrug transport system ATPase subunit